MGKSPCELGAGTDARQARPEAVTLPASRVSAPHLRCISVASPLHLRCISAASPLHLRCTCVASAPHLCCIFPARCCASRAGASGCRDEWRLLDNWQLRALPRSRRHCRRTILGGLPQRFWQKGRRPLSVPRGRAAVPSHGLQRRPGLLQGPSKATVVPLLAACRGAPRLALGGSLILAENRPPHTTRPAVTGTPRWSARATLALKTAQASGPFGMPEK